MTLCGTLVLSRPKMRGKKKKGGKKGGIAEKDKLIKNDNNMFFRMINHGFHLFNIVKRFTFKLLWTGSCFAFMFVVPMLFEVMSEQEAVLDGNLDGVRIDPGDLHPDDHLALALEDVGERVPVSYTHLTLPTICSV